MRNKHERETSMSLPQDIRKGCQFSKPIAAVYVVREGKTVAACALGAAFLAIASYTNREKALRFTEKLREPDYDRSIDLVEKVLTKAWGWTPEDFVLTIKTREGEFKTMTLMEGLAHLNDKLHWTRERIADFLERQGL